MNRCLITNAIAGFRKTKITKSWVRNSSDVHLPKKMRILISGASGLVGQALIPVLQQSGHQVCALTTRKDTVAFSNDVPAHYWNPEKGIFDPSVLNDVDVIISLAGAKIAQRWTTEAKRSILNSRVLGTRILVNALKANKNHNVSHFISASAIGIYPSSDTKVYSESETALSTSFPGQVVQAWENEVDNAVSVVKNVSKIRIGLVLAKGGGALIPLAMPTSFGLGAWFGSGNQWQSWIHIQDLIRLFAFTLDNPGCYNGVAPQPETQKELVKAIAKTYRLPQWLPGVPKFFVKCVMGDMASVLFDSIHASSAAAQNQGFEFEFPTIDTALHDLLPLRNKK